VGQDLGATGQDFGPVAVAAFWHEQRIPVGRDFGFFGEDGQLRVDNRSVGRTRDGFERQLLADESARDTSEDAVEQEATTGRNQDPAPIQARQGGLRVRHLDLGAGVFALCVLEAHVERAQVMALVGAGVPGFGVADEGEVAGAHGVGSSECGSRSRA